MSESNVLQHYAARRRAAMSTGRLDLAKRDARLGADYAAKNYPWTAAECLAAARRDMLAKVRLYTGNQIWAGRGGSDGATFDAYGEKRLRWFENPESKGLRFVGLQGDLSTDRRAETGYYLDEFGDETVSGVVYQLPTRKGEMRFLAGYADPWNCDKAGRGPACLSLQIHSERIEPGYRESRYASGTTANGRVQYTIQRYYVDRQEATDVAKADAIYSAVQSADSIASRMAEAERDYQESFRLGREARETAGEALAAGKAWLSAMREIRSAFKARHKAGTLGQSVAAWRDMIRNRIHETRDLCDEWQEARQKAHSALETGHGWQCGNVEAWREGYSE